MALLGVPFGGKNPPYVVNKDGTVPHAYTMNDFLTYMPAFAAATKKVLCFADTFTEGSTYYRETATDTYTQVLPTNANLDGSALYEKQGDLYVPTTDLVFKDKEYYIDAEGTVASPKVLGLYETDLQRMYNAFFPIAYGKIAYDIFGLDWYYAMSLCIAHYNHLVSGQMPNAVSPKKELSVNEIYGGGATKGVMTSASIGGFNKTYDLSYTAMNTQEAMFWNQSAYGMALMALLRSKGMLTMFVVTTGPLKPGTPPFNRFGDPSRESGQAWVDDMINPRKFRP